MNGNTVEKVEEQLGGRGKWMAHVKKTMKQYPGKKLKEVLKLAKKTYKKITKRGGALSPLPLDETKTGGRRRKTARKTRGNKKY